MDKFCKDCGAQLNPGAKFCRYCGVAIHLPQSMIHTQPQVIAYPLAPQIKERKTPQTKLLLTAIAVILVIALGVAILTGWFGTLFRDAAVSIDSFNGQPYGNRAVTISGKGFGYYDSENSRATIDGIDTPIIGWSDKEITLLVPHDIVAGKKEVRLVNPPIFNKKIVKHVFLEHTKKELARVTLSPEKDNIIEGEGFALIVPQGSVVQKQEITIFQYDTPSLDDSPYWTVAQEYEITGADGGHMFFERPVYFGVNAADAEEAAHSAFQIFDELAGVWVSAETLYSEEEARVYLATTHFSSFRRFVSDMRTGFGRLSQKTIDEAAKKIDFVADKLGEGKNKIVELTQNLYVNIKDATTEEFVGVSDINEYFIVYYRVSDAKNDTALHDKACLMAAAFSTAYKEYRDLFGEYGVPPVTKKALVTPKSDGAPVPLGSIDMSRYQLEDIHNPIKVYIDPRYNKVGAQAKSATTGNIIMPSEYPEDDMASTCAHELFHAVQYHQLGFKQLYMSTTGLKDIVDNRYTGNSTELYRFFANNAWFLEATAEYAGRFIGTGVGVGEPIHPSIEANKAYYVSNGSHDYGVSSFLDYILSTRQTGVDERGDAFKDMWNTVKANYSMASDINTAFDNYVRDKLSKSANMVYIDFWQEAFTRDFMPEVTVIAGGLFDTRAMPREKVSASMDIQENGAGIFRYSLTPAYLPKNDTALTRSFWLEASPASVQGNVYLLDGLEMSNRVSWEPIEGFVNSKVDGAKDVLIAYTAGESLGLVAVFQNTEDSVATVKATLSLTALKWDNQKDIEKKVGNSTLKSSDKLKFTPTLPKQKLGDPPFTALVTLNDNFDYQTEIDLVENGKSFEVGAPMKDLSPDKVTVNIKIFRDGELVHEYQSVDHKADAKVEITGPKTVNYELVESGKQTEHSFSATAFPSGDYDFEWNFGDGSPMKRTSGGSDSELFHSYEGTGEYTAKVTLYDKNGKALSSDSVKIVFEEKVTESSTAGSGMDYAGTYYYWYSSENYIGYNDVVIIEEIGDDAISATFMFEGEIGGSYSLTVKKGTPWDTVYTSDGEEYAKLSTENGNRVFVILGSMGNNSLTYMRIPKDQP